MSWLTWRQHRWEAASALLLLLVLCVCVVLLTVAGSGLLAEISRNCEPTSQSVVATTCGSLSSEYSSSFQSAWWWVAAAGTVIPAFVGVFVGAPLVARELESGTHLLIWAQGITRRRWFLSAIGLVVLGTVGSTALLAAASQGWFAMQRGLGSAGSLSVWDGFEVGPPVLIAYALFGLALGVAAGVVIRRTVPAMAATLVVFIGVRIAVALLARPLYLSPLAARANFGGQSGSYFGTGGPAPSDWLVGAPLLVDGAGHPIPSGGFCLGSGAGCYPQIFAIQHYQPAARFWLFQGIEAAIFVVLALVLFALAYRLVMRMR